MPIRAAFVHSETVIARQNRVPEQRYVKRWIGRMPQTDHPLPPWMERIAVFWFCSSEAKRFAKQLRLKADRQSDLESLKQEADNMVRRDIGAFPSEDTADEWDDPTESQELETSMRQLARDYLESLRETLSYTWGLAIVGIFHVWERDTRRTVINLSQATPSQIEKIERAKFQVLCDHVRGTGFDISTSKAFKQFYRAYLISNTIKHGSGPAFRELALIAPTLFLDPRHSGSIRLSASEFDEAAAAINQIWYGYEISVLNAGRNPA
jgi:hypothetical protein